MLGLSADSELTQLLESSAEVPEPRPAHAQQLLMLNNCTCVR